MSKALSIIYLGLFFGITLFANEHPRILCNDEDRDRLKSEIYKYDWKKALLDKKRRNVAKYLILCNEHPDWLVSRLQMYWESKSENVYIAGGDYLKATGHAPVPTVRFSGSRDWSTNYRSPLLEDVLPYSQDERGLYLQHKETGRKEWVHPSKTGHIIEGINNRIMSIVRDAAFLYWWTGEEKYAKLAEPVFLTYMKGMYFRNPPEDVTNSNQQRLSGLATFEVIHEKIVTHLAITYDFLHSYLVTQNRDLSNIEEVFQKWGDQIIRNGVPDNNWNFFQARFLMYIALVLEADEEYENRKGRDYFLKHIFQTSTERQIAISEAILEYDQKTGFWFESSNYSLHVTSTLLEIIQLLDHYTNENELEKYNVIEKASLSAFQYLFPNGYTVAFGDGRHSTIPPKIFELLISSYRKYGQRDKEITITKILKNMINAGQYKRQPGGFFEFFFYVDTLNNVNIDENILKNILLPTVYAPNVSFFAQRIGKGSNSMMVATTGSFGNHAHSNGISIELYANNYVLGPDMSHGPSYWHPDYRNYYSQFVAHNTVIVDGVSSTGRMRGYHPFTLDNCYPKPGQNIELFDKITFSNVSFVEPSTQADQQRLTAQIISPHKKGYIIDIFRSRRKFSDQQKHEYFYHNLGQDLEIKEDDRPLNLYGTNDLSSDHGDMKGYDYLTDKNKIQTDKDIQAVFTLKEKGKPDNIMKVWVKKSKGQKVYTANAPKSDALSIGTAPKAIIDKKIPTLILRREKESWVDPFSVIFNPFTKNKVNPISNVHFSQFEANPSTQKILVEFSNTKRKDLIVANPSVNDVVEDESFYQKGLLSIARMSTQQEIPEFLFVAGMYRYKFMGWEILSKGKSVNLSIERVDNGFLMQNSQPVVIRIPIVDGVKIDTMEIFEGDTIVESRRGFISRSNPNQIEFRLSKSFEKVKFN